MPTLRWMGCVTAVVLFTAQAIAQTPTTTEQDSLETLRIQRTTKWAAALPGAGQLANRKYWKAPIVWGGVAWCVSAIGYNRNQLKNARNQLIELELADPATVVNYATVLQTARSEEAFYRRQRDLSWFALAGVHALSILDAHVDANLLRFDVSEDLSLHCAPLFLSPDQFGGGLVIRWEVSRDNFPNLGRRLREASQAK